MANRNDKPETYRSEQNVLNWSFDEDKKNLAVVPVLYDPDGSLKYTITKDLTILQDTTTTAGYIYFGFATPGSDTTEGRAAAIWKIFKIADGGSDIKTYADGNANFDNVWNDREGKSYS